MYLGVICNINECGILSSGVGGCCLKYLLQTSTIVLLNVVTELTRGCCSFILLLQKPLHESKIPTWFDHKFFNQFHKVSPVAILCPLSLIAPPPSGAPSLIGVPHRQKPIQSSGPFSPDVADLGHLLEAVEGHVVSVI